MPKLPFKSRNRRPHRSDSPSPPRPVLHAPCFTDGKFTHPSLTPRVAAALASSLSAANSFDVFMEWTAKGVQKLAVYNRGTVVLAGRSGEVLDSLFPDDAKD